MNCEDLDQCLSYLIQEWVSVKPKDANLGNLIRALKAESFNDVAGKFKIYCTNILRQCAIAFPNLKLVSLTAQLETRFYCSQ